MQLGTDQAMDGETMTASETAGATSEGPVTMTERAARRIAKVLGGEPAGTFLRISVEGGGCSGFQYKFDFDTGREDDDFVLTRDDAVVAIDSTSLQFMEGAEIDFVDDLIGQSFQVNNPNATAACGCGTSFSI